MEKNKEKRALYQKEYRIKNPEIFKKALKKYTKKNPEKYKQMQSDSLKRYQAKNKELLRAKALLYARKNSSKRNKYMAEWREENPELAKSKRAEYCKRYPEKMAAQTSKRRASKAMAMPKWADEFIINEIYDLARLRTKLTGIKWHVDHEVPLHSNIVCGLHVESNLRVIQAAENYAKSNKFWAGMP